MDSQNCSKLKEFLVELAEDSLSPELKEEMLAHITECPGCEKLFHDFSELWEELSLPAGREPTVSLWPNLERAIGARKRHPLRSGPPVQGFPGLLRPAAVGLAVLLAVLAGFQLGNPRGDYLPASQRSGPSPELNHEAYAALYFEPFRDIPEGSLAEIYLGEKNQNEDIQP